MFYASVLTRNSDYCWKHVMRPWRIVCLSAWHVPMAIGSNTSTFVGTFASDFPEALYRDTETVPVYQAINGGNNRAITANRLAHFFDFKGISVTVDTACSASMAALHLACQSLRSGESRQSIVAGSSVIMNPDLFISMSALRLLSPDGKSYSFDARGNGYARGEGVGCIVLKPLDIAIADGDTIRAVIRHTGANQDGKTPGITFPSRDAQINLARTVYEQAGLNPLETTYVEAHGTGTQAGDPIETSAIAESIARGRDKPLIIGSVKSNVGHLEGASGIAGLVKGILMLENKMLLPNHDFQKVNDRILLNEWRLHVSQEYGVWPVSGDQVRRLSVNSFGYGGTNAHAILEEADGYLRTHGLRGRYQKTFALVHGRKSTTDVHQNGTVIEADPRPRLFVLSAADPEAGKAFARVLADYLHDRLHLANEDWLDNLAYTLNFRRSRLAYIAPVTAASAEELIDALESEALEFTKTRKAECLAFVCTGQGAQWARMGTELMSFPVYRDTIHRCSKHLVALGSEWDPEEELDKPKATSEINSSKLSQPLCTIVQLGLIDLLASWGVSPTAVAGHSSGEIAAAYAACALSLESAVSAAFYRGVVSDRMATDTDGPRGAMMAVGMSADEALPLIVNLKTGKAGIACINSPSSITVSGDVSAVDELGHILHDRGVFNRKLTVPVAYHSHHMQLVGSEYRSLIAGIETQSLASSTTMFSSVTGSRASTADLGPDYWVSNLLGQVKFSGALHRLCLETTRAGKRKTSKASIGIDAIVEIGPHTALAGPVKQILQADTRIKKAGISYYSALTRGQDAVSTIMTLACNLIRAGYNVDLRPLTTPRSFDQEQLSVLVDLPSYQWNHSRSYWAEGRLSKEYRNRAFPRHDLLGAEDRNFNPLGPRWRNIVRISEIPWLKDHKIQSNVVFPAAGYIAMAVEACRQGATRGGSAVEVTGFVLRDIVIGQALVIPDDSGEAEIDISLKPYNTYHHWDEFCVYSVSPDGRWTEHCRGLIRLEAQKDAATNPVHNVAMPKQSRADRITALRDSCAHTVDVEAFYKKLTALGLDYGPTFANVSSLVSGPGSATGTVSVADTAATMPMEYESSMILHPSTLDAAFHPLFAAVAGTGDLKNPMVPVSIKEMSISASIQHQPGRRVEVVASTTMIDERQCQAGLFVMDPGQTFQQDPLIEITGLNCIALAREDVTSSDESASRKFAYRMAWKPDVDLLSKPLSICEKSHNRGALMEYFSLVMHKIPNARVLCRLTVLQQQDITQAVDLLKQLGGNDGSTLLTKVILRTDAGCRDRCSEAFAPWNGMIQYVEESEQNGITESAQTPEQYDCVLDLSLAATNGSQPRADTDLASILAPGGFHITTARCGEETNTQGMQTIDMGSFTVQRRLKEGSPSAHEITLIESGPDVDSGLQDDLANAFLAKHGVKVSRSPCLDVDVPGRVCIVMSDLLNAALTQVDEKTWALVRRICLESAGILWVTRGATSQQTQANMVTGLLRSVRSETGQVPMVTLDLDDVTALPTAQAAATILQLYEQTFFHTSDSPERLESEFRERDGKVLIPRLLEAVETNAVLRAITTLPEPSPMPFEQPGRPLRIEVGTPGLLDSLYFVDDDETADPLPEDCIEVEVKASGINFRDVMISMGQIPLEPLGGELSGIVTAVGTSVHGHKIGDRVAGNHFGAFRNLVRAKAELMVKMPDEMPFEVAAALPLTYCTVYQALLNVARVQRGETVLIHAASGGVGQAAIELCRLAGARVFVTVGTLEKKQFLVDQYGVAPEDIFWSRDGSFAEAIMAATGGKGVDVILNSLAGEALRLSWGCIASFGRFIELGKRDFFLNSQLDMTKFRNNVTFAAVDLVGLVMEKPALVAEIWQKVMDLVRDGAVRPPTPLESYPMSDLQTALALMRSGKHTGKLVAVPQGQHDMIMALPPRPKAVLFDAASTYLLVGGLGGIGRAIALWMSQHGARNIAFLNRSGAERAEAQETIALLQANGVNAVAHSCDVSDEAALAAVVQSIEQSGAQIKGVIQAAMVLRDTLFEKMTMDDWNVSVLAKVKGTLNLHQALPKDLDFFVMLSSISGVIGNASQANYAAANTFLDAFAERRRALGLHATSLDLGVITEVGHVAEDADLAKAMERQGFVGTNEKQLLALIQTACFSLDCPSQIVTGLGPYQAAGTMGSLSSSPLFSHYRHMFQSVGDFSSGSNSLRANLSASPSLEHAQGLIFTALLDRTAAQCMVAVEDINPAKPLIDYGLDSLVAVELRTWIFKQLDCTIPILELLANTPISKIADKIADKSRLLERLR
ncbi:Reducing polyketide synthase FUB1 [Lachnellula arida]|uniref:Reducing polyketide synthase FUB1 n=1 Tax=Lachnellula arida TaxID=1316785 RepID=A0A8T9BL58_9HELO|nr:Reducing polyketide synthase FUB1 [Lachnellula arida]